MPIKLLNKTGGVEKGKSQKNVMFFFCLGALAAVSCFLCANISRADEAASNSRCFQRERERERVTGRFSDLPPGGWFHLFLSRCSVSCLLREALTRAALAAELQKIAGERRRERGSYWSSHHTVTVWWVSLSHHPFHFLSPLLRRRPPPPRELSLSCSLSLSNNLLRLLSSWLLMILVLERAGSGHKPNPAPFWAS